MTIFVDAHVTIIVADYANTDPIGKLNVLGAGISMFAPVADGVWPPMTVAVVVDVPAKYVDQEYALSVELRDLTHGKALQVPTAEGRLGPLRVQQVVTIPPVQVPPQFKRPTEAMVQHVMVMGFPGGLPLTPGVTYEWRSQIDGQDVKHGRRRFHALAPAAGVILGGPEGPSTIPGVAPDESSDSE
jgi:hypothetical protein